MSTFFLYISLFFITYLILRISQEIKFIVPIKTRRSLILRKGNKVEIRSIVWTLIALIPIFVILTYRYNVGTDWQAYSTMYNDFIKYNFKGDLEIGTRFLMSLSDMLNWGFNGFLFLNAFLGIGVTCCLLKIFIQNKYNSFGILIYLFLYFGSACNTLAQITALSFVLLSYHEILEKNWIKYTIYLFIAYLFHYSALLLLPIYWLYNLDNKFRTRFLWVIIITLTLLITLRPELLQTGLEMIGVTRYSKIFTLTRINTFIIFLISRIPFYIIEFLKRKDLIRNSIHPESIKFYYLIILLEATSCILGIRLSWVGRFMYFFSIGHSFILTDILLDAKSKRERIYWFILILVYLIVMFYSIYFISRFDSISVYEFKSLS